jgi:hypothetical protein
MKEYSYTDPVNKLLTIGEVNRSVGWLDYGELGLAKGHIPELIRMLTDEELNTAASDSREVWAPLHAWRALGQLHAVEAIEPLIQQLYRIDEEDDDWVGEEFPEVFAMIGAPAIPSLASYLATQSHGLWARACSVHCVADIGRSAPEERSRCIRVLTEELMKCAQNDPTLNGFLINYLIGLKAVESIETIRRAFDRDCVDFSVAGDFEAVEMELGLIQHRSTPQPPFLWISKHKEQQAGGSTTTIPPGRKIGRNEPCPCGSGKKYKKCCLNKG